MSRSRRPMIRLRSPRSSVNRSATSWMRSIPIVNLGGMLFQTAAFAAFAGSTGGASGSKIIGSYGARVVVQSPALPACWPAYCCWKDDLEFQETRSSRSERASPDATSRSPSLRKQIVEATIDFL